MHVHGVVMTRLGDRFGEGVGRVQVDDNPIDCPQHERPDADEYDYASLEVGNHGVCPGR